jgi:hypothetical protein
VRLVAHGPVARARVRTAEPMLADARERLRFADRVQDPLAISAEELSRRRHAVKTIAARLEDADMGRGTWLDGRQETSNPV